MGGRVKRKQEGGMKRINICEYSKTPGGRYRHEGPFSGEDFRETVLEPEYANAVRSNERIEICLDGVFGYPTSFLEETFGGMVRVLKSAEFMKIITLISEDQPSLIDEINGYIEEAKAEL